MANYTHPPGFRFVGGGMNLREVADALPPNKYPLLVNVRMVEQQGLATRPGYNTGFSTDLSSQVTDIRSYATLSTDDVPRFLARTNSNKIYLDTGSLVATLDGSGQTGATLLPFRPSNSNMTWMYITNGADYQKLEAPNNSNVVVAQKVGVAEPQIPVGAVESEETFTTFATGSWTGGGNAGSTSTVSLINDTVGTVVIADPLLGSRYSIQVGHSYYQPGMMLTFNGSSTHPVEAIWPPCATCTVTAIYYHSGTSGLCTIVPSKDLSQQIGRGALLTIDTESVFVLDVIAGINGTCSFECSTSGTHSPAEAITGIQGIVVNGTPATGQTITLAVTGATLTGAGTGTLSQGISSPFGDYTPDDYLHMVLLLTSPSLVTSVSVILNIGPTVDYTSSILTYTLVGAPLAAAIQTGGVVTINIPVSAMGGDATNTNGIQISTLVTGTCTVSVGAVWVGGGGAPDIGADGAPYQYRIVPRSGTTGAQGNSSPTMRYGVSPRRQIVTVKTSTLTFSDPQVTLLDVYRYGGSITSYRYIGTAPVGSDFTDNFFDDTATAGQVLPTENFEPWPSIDKPFSVASGGGNTITLFGSYLVVVGPTSWPATIGAWLPGTLVSLTGLGTFTLRARPTQISSTSYLFQLEESGGSFSSSLLTILEPNVANEILPYIFGPDKYGSVFGVGDPLRPGTIYWAQPFAPDMVADTSSLEVCPPSEPLLGGALLNDLPFCASPQRWWALYPNFQLPGSYTQVEVPVGRGLAVPRGICTDGKAIYFWAKDGIYVHNGGLATSLTDADLYPLFPHEGVPGANKPAYSPFIAYAPDYSRAYSFRLSVVNNILFADYQDSGGNPRTLVCDLRTISWVIDQYGDPLTVHYQPEQTPGAITASHVSHTLMVMGDANGEVWIEEPLFNDASTPIVGYVGTFEWDGGDGRIQPQFGDLYLDALVAAKGTYSGAGGPGVFITPLSLQQPVVGVNTLIAPTTPIATRMFSPVSLNGEYTGKCIGMGVQWVDDFSQQIVPTTLYQWGVTAVPRPEITRDRIGDWYNSING